MTARRSIIAAVLTVALSLSAVVVAGAAPTLVEPGTAKPQDFEPSTGCGCHASFVDQWSETMHAQALTDPIYQAKLEEAQKATKGTIGAYCNKCHGPNATMTGEIDSDAPSPAAAEAITCTFCHQATGLGAKPANTSHLVEADGVRRAQIKDPKAAHAAAYSQFHESAEICGGCHNVDHPGNGMHLEATYTEWKNGPYAKEGIVCQDCHMSVQPGAIGPVKGKAAAGAPDRDNIYQMHFVGGQVALGPSEMATERLKSAAEVTLEMPAVVEPGKEASISVEIANVGAGHYLPTGLTEVRQMWLEVFSEGEDGTKTPIGEQEFGTHLENAKGDAPVELWEAVKIHWDYRIPPKGSVTETFTFEMPAGTEHTKVTAALYYKSVPDELAEKAGVENPTTEMASAATDVFADEAAQIAFAEQAREDAAGEHSGDAMWNTAVVAGGLVLVIGLAVFFYLRSRKAA